MYKTTQGLVNELAMDNTMVSRFPGIKKLSDNVNIALKAVRTMANVDLDSLNLDHTVDYIEGDNDIRFDFGSAVLRVNVPLAEAQNKFCWQVIFYSNLNFENSSNIYLLNGWYVRTVDANHMWTFENAMIYLKEWVSMSDIEKKNFIEDEAKEQAS